ncbi:MAG: MFS transporter [Pseudomonadota bacterium]
MAQTRLAWPTLAIFALPALVSAITHGPIAGILPALYAQRFSIDLALVGTVLLTARIFDAVTDPLIGYFSDRTQSRFGRRKPWVVTGAGIVVFAIFFLFRPGDNAGAAYFLIFSLLIYLGWTVMEIPYASWALELSRSTKERARINASRTFFLFIGGLLFTLSPLLLPNENGTIPLFMEGNDFFTNIMTSNTRMTFDVLSALAFAVIILVPVATALAVTLVPTGDVIMTKEKPRLTELWASLRDNPPFKAFLMAYLFIGVASGVSGVVSFMYIDSYLTIGDRYTQLFGPAILVGPLVVPFWGWVINRFGKYRVTAAAFTIYTAILPLPWFIAPGPEAFAPMVAYYCAITAFSPLLMIAMPTMLGDIIDYDELRTGKNRAGQYYAFLALISKTTASVGGPIALFIIGFFGYQPGAENDAEAILGLRVVANLLPALGVIPALYILWRFPITDASQQDYAARLDARMTKSTVAER